MNFIESLNSAMKSLMGNRARSFLTMLGIIIGISSVITMSAIGKGGQQNITGDLKEGGYGKFTVYLDKSNEGYRHKYLFDDTLIDSLRKTDEFKNISPDVSRRMFSKIDGRRNLVWGDAVTPEFQNINKIDIMYGREFLTYEYEDAEKIAIIDHITAATLYGNAESAIGKTFDVSISWSAKPISFKIVGIFKNPYEDFVKTMGRTRVPKFIRYPLSTHSRLYDSSGAYQTILVEAKNPEKAAESMTRMVEILEKMSGVKDLYAVETVSSGVASFDKILTTLNLFITFVAGISLFVGGIGVMNIMLVSVIERTKEIGIRKAIGATNKDILSQFLIESVILTGIGGIIGVILGITFALIVGNIVNIPPVFTLSSIFSSLFVSMGIGIIFGVFPAKKASQLNPIEALRAE